jgi:hypothetical protein
MVDVDFTSGIVAFKIQFRFQLDALYFVEEIGILGQVSQTCVPPIRCTRLAQLSYINYKMRLVTKLSNFFERLFICLHVWTSIS